MIKKRYIFSVVVIPAFLLTLTSFQQKIPEPGFRVIGFFSATDEIAHISFVHEANRWFEEMSRQYNFVYDSTTNWKNMNEKFLSGYSVAVFLDSRPDSADQRTAFRNFMENGGAWMGFHFSGFALTPSAFPQDWDWYHNDFLGSGEYKGNTWRPTSAVLRVEDHDHPATRDLPSTFVSAPNEWYSWKNDLRNNSSIHVLLSIDPSSFPLGTGPKQYEIWHSGYYPVAWTNINFKMIYINMGHNDIDYENKTFRELSLTFNNETQDGFILNALFWLAGYEKKVF